MSREGLSLPSVGATDDRRCVEGSACPKWGDVGTCAPAGKTFVLTGALDRLAREEATARLLALGGAVSESVSAMTSYVVVGRDPGAKQARARRLGVPHLDEAGLLKLIGDERQRGLGDPRSPRSR
jgi:NAD-dependent DNA ligase